MHTCLVRLSNISHYEIVSSYLQLCQSLIICTEIFHTEYLHKAEFVFFYEDKQLNHFWDQD